MSRIFSIDKKPYDRSVTLYKCDAITLMPGVTVLVGCNGSGKTTLLRMLKKQLEEHNIPVLSFDNLSDGGQSARECAVHNGDMSFLAQAITSSEGENIVLNVGQLASTLRQFIQTGNKEDSTTKLVRMITGEKEKQITSNERWLLLDAIDSGLSVDNVVDIKNLFNVILEDAGNKVVYIVVSANEYELARNEACFDAYNGRYVQFSDYEEYRKFVLDSRTQKDKRYVKKGGAPV